MARARGSDRSRGGGAGPDEVAEAALAESHVLLPAELRKALADGAAVLTRQPEALPASRSQGVQGDQRDPSPG